LAILFLGNNSIRGQNAVDMTMVDNTTTIQGAGKYRIPTSWILAQPNNTNVDCLIKVVAEEGIAGVEIGVDMTLFEIIARTTPTGHPNGSTMRGPTWIAASLPGIYLLAIRRISGGSSWNIEYTVSYISDPWVGVDQAATTASPHLSDPQFGAPTEKRITAENFVKLKLSSVFADLNFVKKVYKDEALYQDEAQIIANNLEIEIQESGNYALLTRSGGGSPGEILYFTVNITTPPTPTPTVSNVIVFPSSASININGGSGQQFTATVEGTNNPGQEVVWTVEGNISSAATTISSSGYLSVAIDETASLLTVRATSVVDPTKSGTSVNVVIHTCQLIVNGGTGSGSYVAGAVINITANAPASGKRFKNWTSSNGGSFADINSASTTFTMPGNWVVVTVTANYEEIPAVQYTVATSSNPSEGGSTTGGGAFAEGTSQTVVASPATDYRFVNWTENGVPVSTDASYTFTLNENRTLVANFEQNPPPIDYSWLKFPTVEYTVAGNQATVVVIAPGNATFTKLFIDGNEQTSWTFPFTVGQVYEIKITSPEGLIIKETKKF